MTALHILIYPRYVTDNSISRTLKKGGKHGRVVLFSLGVNMNIDMESVCQIRTETGLPCDRCKYSQTCKTYLKEKEKSENGKKKQRRSTGRKKNL